MNHSRKMGQLLVAGTMLMVLGLIVRGLPQRWIEPPTKKQTPPTFLPAQPQPSDEERYRLALDLLRPHLTWHAPYLPRFNEKDRLADLKKKQETEHPRDDAWQEAMPGEGAMLGDIPQNARDVLRFAVETFNVHRDDPLPEPAVSSFFWRIRDPQHPDIARALTLLEAIKDETLSAKAQRWAAEVRRNNTVLTFDVAGGFASNAPARVMLDVRNADRIALTLYRVRKPAELLGVLDRIGDDFIYQDHDLGGKHLVERIKRIKRGEGKARSWSKQTPRPPLTPAPGQVVRQWTVATEELPHLDRLAWQDGGWDRWEPEDDDESEYFDDRGRVAERRLARDYRPEHNQLSSWRCGRIVELRPEDVKESGAYVLAAEANGQTVYVPLIVDPLSLTMRRCRDGVFALVSETSGKTPVTNAELLGREQLGTARTDASGAGFARVFAMGHRAIVAHKDGRYAVGGFGRVFDGMSHTDRDRWAERVERVRSTRDLRKPGQDLAQFYTDRHLVAAWTDRPTYRPGQTVQFKLIARRLAEPKGTEGKAAFRAEDFDIEGNLLLLPPGTEAPYGVLDPRGREVASGKLALNDFGTAADRIDLSAETPSGPYSLRVRLGGLDRIVPDVFAVKHYRLPSFELTVQGLPKSLKTLADVELSFTGRYYFGKPVAGGRVEAKLFPPGERVPLTETDATLDRDGKGTAALRLPRRLESGAYTVVCTLTDESDRVVTVTTPLVVEGTGVTPGNDLAGLPRYVAVGKSLVIRTKQDGVTAESTKAGKGTYRAENGVATVDFLQPGWYRLTAGQQEGFVYAYGGEDPPEIRPHDEENRLPGWVNLSAYESEDEGYSSPRRDEEHMLLALFDRQQTAVGEKLRVLVYVPAKRARLLFTMEGRTVLDYFTTWTPDEAGPYHVIEIPVTRRHLPNFYLQGCVIVRAEDGKELLEKMADLKEKARDSRGDGSEDPRWCRIDVTDPDRPAADERLQVKVEPARADYRPGEKVDVVLRVTDAKGTPRSAEVSLQAVDESVYTFGEDNLGTLAAAFSDPHPPQRYMRKTWRSSVGEHWTRRARGEVKEALSQQEEAIRELAKAAKSGEGKGRLEPALERFLPLPQLPGLLPSTSIPLARIRNDFRETATWQPQLRTGNDGVVRTSFTLPDGLTRYRLSAVALTRETEIGIARAAIRTSLPLSVQVMLPRFAVESDRLLAVGLIHNDGSKDRTCALTWNVEGAKVDGLAEGLAQNVEDWHVEPGAKTVGRGRVTVPAGKSVRLGMWLIADRVGTARVEFRCGDGADTDGEVRTLPVQPLGRDREVSFHGSFRNRKTLQLPDGFMAREINLVLSRGEAAQALDGLGSLIDYPYGCVEQTMSRFLPAVVVRDALRKAPISLPPDVTAKLPGVLSRGLARLYHFQHDDGGWGWWENDATDDRMTIYVVEGLARCRAAGTKIDEGVLACGCNRIKDRLRSGELTPALIARAWLALALAGAADAEGLRRAAEGSARCTEEDRARLALASRCLGMVDAANRIWKELQPWQPDTSESLALKLALQTASGSPASDLRATADRLMARRTGLHWDNTQTTALAITALADMLATATGEGAARRVKVTVGGRTVLDLKDPSELAKLVHRVRVPAEQLPRSEGLTVEMEGESDVEMFFTLAATGTQRLDKVEATGTELRMERRFETLDGKPLTGRLKVGQVFAVRLIVDAAKEQRYVLIEDRRPSGCEFADERVEKDGPAALSSVEFRDDRVCLFAGRLPSGRHEFVYLLRAETAGVSHALPGCVYPMYGDPLRGETGPATLEIAKE